MRFLLRATCAKGHRRRAAVFIAKPRAQRPPPTGCGFYCERRAQRPPPKGCGFYCDDVTTFIAGRRSARCHRLCGFCCDGVSRRAVAAGAVFLATTSVGQHRCGCFLLRRRLLVVVRCGQFFRTHAGPASPEVVAGRSLRAVLRLIACVARRMNFEDRCLTGLEGLHAR